MVEFIIGPIWAWSFFWRKILSYIFNFFNSYIAIQVTFFFQLILVGCVFKELCLFPLCCQIPWHKVVSNSTLLTFLMFARSLVVFLLSFLVVLCLLLFKIWISLARGLSILLLRFHCFPKICSFSISLTFIISTLGLLCFLFFFFFC